MLVEDRVAKVFEEIGIDKNELHPEAVLKTGLGVDSTEMVELLIALEKEFSIKIPDGAINGGSTIREIMKYFSTGAARP
ncbi:MAG: acyl carrier protein [Nitrospirota bacterium]